MVEGEAVVLGAEVVIEVVIEVVVEGDITILSIKYKLEIKLIYI